jgi:hypothetical protein
MPFFDYGRLNPCAEWPRIPISSLCENSAIILGVSDQYVINITHNRHAAENLNRYRTIEIEFKAIRWPPEKMSCLSLLINGARILFRILAQIFCVPRILIAYAAKGLPSAIT